MLAVAPERELDELLERCVVAVGRLLDEPLERCVVAVGIWPVVARWLTAVGR